MRRGRSDVSRFDTRRVLCKQHQNHCVNAALSPRKPSCSLNMRTQTSNRNRAGQHLQTKGQWANCSLTFGAWAKASRSINPRATRQRKTGSSELAGGILPLKSKAAGSVTQGMAQPFLLFGRAIRTQERSVSHATAMQICLSWSGWIMCSQVYTTPLACLCHGLEICKAPSSLVAQSECGPREKTLSGCLGDKASLWTHRARGACDLLRFSENLARFAQLR